MDDKDRLIIKILQENARTSTATIGRTLGVSRATAQNRIDRLVSQGVISRFTIELGEALKNTMIDALVLVKTNAVDTRPLIIKLQKMRQVQRFTSLNGDYDFALELRVKSTVELDEAIADIRSHQHIINTNCSIHLNKFV